MYHRTEGTAPPSENLSRHNLPQTVDQPNTFTKLQVFYGFLIGSDQGGGGVNVIKLSYKTSLRCKIDTDS